MDLIKSINQEIYALINNKKTLIIIKYIFLNQEIYALINNKKTLIIIKYIFLKVESRM